MTRFVTAFILVTLLAVAAQAQPAGVSFTVSPIDIELAVAPGNAAIAALTVRNNSARTTAFSARIEESTSAWSASPFVRVNPSEFSLQPGRTIALRISAAIPKGIEGGRYAHILIASLPLSAASGNYIVGITPQIAARISVTVKGSEKISAGIQSIAARFKNGSVEVRIVFANRGNVHVRPIGELTVLTDGKTVRTVPIRLTFQLPDSTQQANLTLDDLPPGPYVIRVTVDFGTNRLSVGEVTLR